MTARIAIVLVAVNASVAQPFPRADIDAGGRIYRSHCAECHGIQGEGGRGPNLQRGEYFHGSSDAALARTIQRGVPGTEMPGIYYEGKPILQLVAYVRDLASRTAQESLRGDPAKGEALYAKLACGACHLVRGVGGRSGPELTYIGSARPVAHLRDAVVNPSAEIPTLWRTTEVVDADGRAHKGFILGEDSFSIRMLDSSSTLRSFPRSSLRRVSTDAKTSLMPSYRDRLSDSELEDLITYLSGLRRRAEDK